MKDLTACEYFKKISQHQKKYTELLSTMATYPSLQGCYYIEV